MSTARKSAPQPTAAPPHAAPPHAAPPHAAPPPDLPPPDLPPLSADMAAAVEDVWFELIDRTLKERHMDMESSEIGLSIGTELRVFLKSNPVGFAFGADGGFRCVAGRPQRVRKPDAAFLSFDRNGSRTAPRGWSPVPAELVVEVISPHDVHSDLSAKVRDYLTNGFDEVWVASPDEREITVRTRDSVALLTAGQYVDGRGPLRGLRFRVGDVFPAD